MPMPFKRLFSVNVGAFNAENGIPDAVLRSRTEQVGTSTMTLFEAAGLSGQLTMAHSTANGSWFINIDAESPLFEKLELFDEACPDSIEPIEAADRVTVNATNEIRRFMAEQQPMNLAKVQQAARQINRQAAAGPVVATLRREPGQTMTLATRNGELRLTLQGIHGNALADETRPIVCQISRLGLDGATLTLPVGERQGIPKSAGHRPRLTIPPSLANADVLARIFEAYVLTRANIMIQARDVTDRRTGRVTELQLAGWPADAATATGESATTDSARQD